MKRVLTLSVFLMLSIFISNAHGDGGVILQPVQKPSPGQSYATLEIVELWLVHEPNSIRHCEVKAIIDGEEVQLTLKGVTFCEIWQIPAEVWTANISLSPGEHVCKYIYIQSVRQNNDFWADFQVCTAEPFKFNVASEMLPSGLQQHQTKSTNASENQESVRILATQSLEISETGICLLIASVLVAYIIKKKSRLGKS